MNNLKLIVSDNFGNVRCNFYRNMNKDILMTREQIGQALEYKNPSDAIKDIHNRHKKRFDKFSVKCKLHGTDKKLYMTYLYNAKGVYEICRWSHQSKADSFMDWVWDIIENIRTMNNSQIDYMVKREVGKIERRSLTDSIKELPTSPHKGFKYKHYTDLFYKIIFDKNAQQLRTQFGITKKDHLRDYFTPDELHKVTILEKQAGTLIDLGLSYQQIKKILLSKYYTMTQGGCKHGRLQSYQ
ncbi:BRO family protein [Clostridium tyrobutyricum]|uniref:BRO family protein n=1 Tax=Clostridium tyrobutyricum TaxID=1519 RepID=UPI00189E92B4|nr:BRO family protein [Clostridium tyrobutyricum]